MSSDPEQEYFSDGMTEDLITELSALSGLFVIARNSVSTYKGKAVKPEQVRRELGVRYMLEGSVRKTKDRVRITVQLVDTMTSYQLWATRYDRVVQDIFAVQEEIAQRITRALAVQLTPEEAEQMGRPYTFSVAAWGYFIRGLALYRLYKKEANAQARELFKKAIDLDPEFARAYAMVAATHRQDGNQEWTDDRNASEALALQWAHYAVELARRELDPKPSLPYALEQWGWVLLYIGTQPAHALNGPQPETALNEALAAAEEAVRRNPNFANGYALGAHVLSYLGRPDEAPPKSDEALRLDPKAVLQDHYHRGHATYVRGYLAAAGGDVAAARGHYLEAKEHFQAALGRNNNYRPARSFLVAVLWELGQQDEAKRQMIILRDTGRPQHFREPERFQAYVRRGNPYANPAITARLMQVWEDAETPGP
jgi:adenylate cyclase